ncbi:MAG TPA: hypothetical protein PLE85_07235, partial [Bacteroidales bacterium]|nr:hypothetical protein [Bacteroidales bacterium]
MKKFTTWMMTGLAVLLASCSTTYSTGGGYDEIYSSRSNETPVAVKPAAQEKVAAPDYAEAAQPVNPSQGYDQGYTDQGYVQESYASPDPQTQTYTTPEGDVYITNYYYGNDYQFNDYYDYAYASRLRRFGHPTYNDYYHDYYTNYYWYNYDPWYYGTSIYLGYNFWYPSYYYYRPSFYMGWNYGFFNIGWGWGWPYSRWYSPYYSYGGWGWPSYSMGYWHGYWDGFYDGHYGGYYSYYYNSYDYNAYYGPRTPRSSTSGTSRSGREPRTLGERFESAMASQGVTTGRANRLASAAEIERRSAGSSFGPANRNETAAPGSTAEGSDALQRRVIDRSGTSEPATRVIPSTETRPDSRQQVEARPETSQPTQVRPESRQPVQARPETSQPTQV